MTDRWRIWGAIALVATFGIAGGLVLYPVVTPEDDAGLVRSLILRVSTMFVGFTFLLLAVLAFDSVTPNDWLEDIEKHPMAEATVVSTLMLSLALIFIYS